MPKANWKEATLKMTKLKIKVIVKNGDTKMSFWFVKLLRLRFRVKFGF